MASDVDWMRIAYDYAKQAEFENEVPVGAIVVMNEEIIGYGYNQPIQHSDPSHHAEMAAIRMAAKHVGNYRLLNCTLYVTLEPCAMCAGLILHSRIKRLVIGAMDEKAGAVGGAMTVIGHTSNTHKVEVTQGVLDVPCQLLLRDFFKRRRQSKSLVEPIIPSI